MKENQYIPKGRVQVAKVSAIDLVGLFLVSGKPL